jgi:hypothetical protein
VGACGGTTAGWRSGGGGGGRRIGGALAFAIFLAALAVSPAVAATGSPSLSDTTAQDSLPRHELLDHALAAYHRLEDEGRVHTRLLTVIDYSLPSFERRLWVLDPSRMKVLFREFVAHGRGSTDNDNPEYAVRFGNQSSSLRSSIGTFLTGSIYDGAHGPSLELIGLDAGVNDNALERRIVIHSAAYVGMRYREAHEGSVGRSWGCPALDPAVAPRIITSIQDASVLYAEGRTG